MAQYNLLTDEERRILFDIPTDHAALIRHYTLTPDEIEFVLARRGDRNRLGVAVQLCLLRYPGFGLRDNEPVPDELLSYLARQLVVPPEVYRDYGRRRPTRIEHAQEMARRLRLRSSGRSDMPLMVDIAAAAAWSSDRGIEIADVLMNGLRERKIILPAVSTLERAGATGRARARRLTADALLASLTTDQLAQIDDLLVNDPALGRTPLAWLRKFPEAPSAGNLTDILARLDRVREIGLEPRLADAIHKSRFRQFVREGAVAPASLLSAYGARRRRATLVAQMIDLETHLSDAAIEMYDKLVGMMFTRAKRLKERQYQSTTRDVGRLMRLFHQTLVALQGARDQDLDAFSVLDDEVGWWTLVRAQPEVAALADMAQQDPLVTATEKYMTLRRYAPAFIEAFTFKSATARDPVLSAIEILRELNRKGRGEIPETAPMSFSQKKWKALVVQGGKVDRRRYEVAICATLRDRLRSGDIWIDGTRNYQRFDRYLLPRSAVPEHAAKLPLNLDVHHYLQERTQLLDWRLRRFERKLKRGQLEHVDLRGGRLHVTPLTAITPPQADSLDRMIDDLMPRVRVTELLTEVARRTGFLAAFTDLRTGRPHDNPNAVLAAILADATNLGLERMANASQGVSYAQLAWTHDWYLREDTYGAALATIIDAHHTHPFADIWGKGATSSSDGQFVRTGRGRGGHAAVNAKYSIDPGVRFYTHVSDQHGSYRSIVISSTGSEAPYVLDGLMLLGTSLEITEHYTDTGGASDHVFGLSHMLGFRFVPWLRDLVERKLASVGSVSRYPGLKDLLGKPIRTDAIVECWDDVIRTAASLEARTVAPSVLLKKLAAYRRQNRLDLAIQEIGRIERTLFTLDWLEDPDLRRHCRAGLNKGEARHFLAQAIYTQRQGRISDRTLLNQSFRASGLNLVIAAIVYWNTVYMERAVQHLRSTGLDVHHRLLAHVAPLGWSHISLTGDYLWEQAAQRPLDYHPLRSHDERLYAAK
ncbi:Tn3 family transposase [Thalassobaculum litoreum]|uniref:Transposase and inactivated derivatives, TnpA family n=1 Tax=Thalassobaculum litoreum DSM 18839 TaxID=1123362 RepID=A0A8G2F0B7_9PROT|nr:Tn3 family transposase [Thalassobaculum litoreum]SDG57985.1 Transposase and inactivated derivatives, TnpA family [Thalassobaculum litoreum DSM 18839]